MTRDEHDGEPPPGREDVERFRAALGFSTQDGLRQAVGPWRERDAEPERGQLRLGPPVGDGDERHRDLYVLVGAPFEDFGRRWWTAMALDTEVEASTAADAVVQRSETGLGVPLRLRTDHAAPVPDAELGGAVATLDAALLESIERGELEPERFGLESRGADDWRLAVDPGAARRWVARRATYEREARAFDAALRHLERGWLDTYRRASDAVRRRLPDIFGALPAPGAPAPTPAVIAAVVQRLTGLSPQEDVALAGMAEELAPADAFWPISLRNREELEAHVDPVGPGARVTLTGLPAEIEGLRPVVAVPMATDGGGEAEWFRGVPGLVQTEAPVRGGRASVLLERADADDPALIRDLVVLPPMDALGPEGIGC